MLIYQVHNCSSYLPNTGNHTVPLPSPPKTNCTTAHVKYIQHRHVHPPPHRPSTFQHSSSGHSPNEQAKRTSAFIDRTRVFSPCNTSCGTQASTWYTLRKAAARDGTALNPLPSHTYAKTSHDTQNYQRATHELSVEEITALYSNI